MGKFTNKWVLITVLLFLVSALAACGDVTPGSDNNSAPPLPTVTAGITPIVPPSQALSNQPGSVPNAPAPTPILNPLPVQKTQPVAAACTSQADREIEGTTENSVPGIITVDKQTYRYDPALITRNGKLPQIGSKVHLSLRCTSGQLVVAKLIVQGQDKAKDNGDESDNETDSINQSSDRSGIALNAFNNGKGAGKKPKK